MTNQITEALILAFIGLLGAGGWVMAIRESGRAHRYRLRSIGLAKELEDKNRECESCLHRRIHNL